MKWLKYYREKSGLSMNKLSDLLQVKLNTIWRWENNKASTSVEMASALAKIFNITETELLNGPEGERSHVTLSYDWKKFEKGDVDMTGKGYELFLGADGVVGIKGSMLLKSKEAIKNFLAEIEEQLTVGYEAQERRGALKEHKDI